MQTFLPYANFARSAEVLDDRRLGKQRVEVLQILRALHLYEYGWSRHPAVLMWRGCTDALVAYGLAVVDEWCARGRADTTRPNISEFSSVTLTSGQTPAPTRTPPWLGSAQFHRSHRSALVRKDPTWYGPLFPDADPALDYVWPEPPGEAPEPQDFSAWAARAAAPEMLDAFRNRGLVGAPATFGSPGATPKQRRQHRLFAEVVAPGDPIVAFLGDRLHIGVVTGEPARRVVRGGRYSVRDVTWTGQAERRTMRRPYQLQDPRTVFALEGESWIG